MLDHYSASQINQFASEPALWLLRRFRPDVKDTVGPGAWRGTAIEAALDRLLYFPDTTEEELVAIALEVFEREAQGEL